MEEIRNKGSEALSIVIDKENNIKILEKNVFKISCKQSEDNDDHLENIYLRNIYQVINNIQNGCKLNTVLSSIKRGEIGWYHKNFENLRFNEEEQDNFINNPFEVEEGVLECKCGSKRVFSFVKQTRKADESATTFAQCMKCNSTWTYSG